MKKVTTVLIAAIVTISMVVPLAASAQTTTASNASLIAILTQLVQLLEQELQQLIAMHGGSSIPPPTSVPTCTDTISPALVAPSQTFTDTWTSANATSMSLTATLGGTAVVGPGPTGLNDTYQTSWSTPGTYSYIRTVTGPGGTGSCSATLTVTSSATSSVSFTATPTSGTAPLTVTFSTSYQEGDGIDFGDGTTDSPSCFIGDFGAQSGCIASHSYTTPGTYTAKLFQQTNICGGAVQLAGCVSQLQVGSVTITVSAGSQPNPTFSASPTSGPAPLAVSFNYTGQYSQSTISFGDGATSSPTCFIGDFGVQSGCVASHTYTAVGTYTATFTSNGQTVGTVTVTVGGSNPSLQPTCSMSYSPSSVQPNQNSTLTWNSTNATYAIISPWNGQWPANGSIVGAHSGQTLTSQGTFYGSNGTATCNATLTVTTNS